MLHRERYAEASDAVDELAVALGSDADPSDESVTRMVKGVGRVFLGIWHELHRIADGLAARDE